jgi:ElaB/YqjD/DUF883 family membrane-anchored ribosome-binding protein
MHSPFANAKLAAKDHESAIHQAAGIASDVSREFSHFIADIEDLIKQTASLTGEDLAQAKSMLNARISAARKSVDGLSTSVSKQVRKSSALTNEYVHEQPWKVIGAVAAVSFLLGVVTTHRR